MEKVESMQDQIKVTWRMKTSSRNDRNEMLGAKF